MGGFIACEEEPYGGSLYRIPNSRQVSQSLSTEARNISVCLEQRNWPYLCELTRKSNPQCIYNYPTWREQIRDKGIKTPHTPSQAVCLLRIVEKDLIMLRRKYRVQSFSNFLLTVRRRRVSIRNDRVVGVNDGSDGIFCI